MTISPISDAECKLHKMGERHPQCPACLDPIQNQLLSGGLNFLPIHVEKAKLHQNYDETVIPEFRFSEAWLNQWSNRPPDDITYNLRKYTCVFNQRSLISRFKPPRNLLRSIRNGGCMTPNPAFDAIEHKDFLVNALICSSG